MEEPDGVSIVAGAWGVVLAILQDKVEGRGQGVGFRGSEGAPGAEQVD